MARPDPHREARVTRAATRAMSIPALTEALETFRAWDMAHARSNSEDDYLGLLIAEYELAQTVAQVTGWDMCDEQERIMGEARSECSFSIKEGLFYNDNGDLVPGGARPKRGPDPDAEWNWRGVA